MLILLVLLLASDAVAPVAPHLRGASAREKALIDELLARSATARALAAEIEARDVIVYVQMTRTLARTRAVTGFVTAAGGTRYIRITLGAVPNRDELAALLAHELQHATEIARSPNVKDDAGVRRLYLAIGEERGAGNAFETAAARDVGARVRTELSRGEKVERGKTDGTEAPDLKNGATESTKKTEKTTDFSFPIPLFSPLLHF